VAFLSAFFIILGSSYAYKRMVKAQLKSGNYEENRDLLDTIEDPHELYDDVVINDAPAEELDLKAIVKEEKQKIKTFDAKSAKYGARGSISAFRLVPYLFLVLGFIALKNNDILSLWYYLPALTFGIVMGSVISKDVIA
jgi:DNA primase large subunit